MGIVNREPLATLFSAFSYEVPAVKGIDDSGGVTFAVAVKDDGKGFSMDPDGGAAKVPDGVTGVSAIFAVAVGCTGWGTGSTFATAGVGSTNVLLGVAEVTGAAGGLGITGAIGGVTTGNTGGETS